MSDYSVTTNFGAKDALATGNVGKRILGAELTTEFSNIATHVATKYDSADRGAASGVASLDSSTHGLEVELAITAIRNAASGGYGSFTPTWTATGGGSIASVAGDWWWQLFTFTVASVTYGYVILQPSHTGVTLVGAITGTVTALNITNIPAAIRPQDASIVVPVCLQNNSLSEFGVASLTTAGVLTFARPGAAAFTGTSGLYGTGPQLVYSFKQDAP